MGKQNAKPPDGQLTLLDLFLRLFNDVHPGESVTVLLMLANIFLILTCYYVIKTILKFRKLY